MNREQQDIQWNLADMRGTGKNYIFNSLSNTGRDLTDDWRVTTGYLQIEASNVSLRENNNYRDYNILDDIKYPEDYLLGRPRNPRFTVDFVDDVTSDTDDLTKKMQDADQLRMDRHNAFRNYMSEMINMNEDMTPDQRLLFERNAMFRRHKLFVEVEKEHTLCNGNKLKPDITCGRYRKRSSLNDDTKKWKLNSSIRGPDYDYETLFVEVAFARSPNLAVQDKLIKYRPLLVHTFLREFGRKTVTLAVFILTPSNQPIGRIFGFENSYESILHRSDYHFAALKTASTVMTDIIRRLAICDSADGGSTSAYRTRMSQITTTKPVDLNVLQNIRLPSPRPVYKEHVGNRTEDQILSREDFVLKNFFTYVKYLQTSNKLIALSPRDLIPTEAKVLKGFSDANRARRDNYKIVSTPKRCFSINMPSIPQGYGKLTIPQMSDWETEVMKLLCKSSRTDVCNNSYINKIIKLFRTVEEIKNPAVMSGKEQIDTHSEKINGMTLRAIKNKIKEIRGKIANWHRNADTNDLRFDLLKAELKTYKQHEQDLSQRFRGKVKSDYTRLSAIRRRLVKLPAGLIDDDDRLNIGIGASKARKDEIKQGKPKVVVRTLDTLSNDHPLDEIEQYMRNLTKDVPAEGIKRAEFNGDRISDYRDPMSTYDDNILTDDLDKVITNIIEGYNKRVISVHYEIISKIAKAIIFYSGLNIKNDEIVFTTCGIDGFILVLGPGPSSYGRDQSHPFFMIYRESMLLGSENLFGTKWLIQAEQKIYVTASERIKTSKLVHLVGLSTSIPQLMVHNVDVKNKVNADGSVSLDNNFWMDLTFKACLKESNLKRLEIMLANTRYLITDGAAMFSDVQGLIAEKFNSRLPTLLELYAYKRIEKRMPLLVRKKGDDVHLEARIDEDTSEVITEDIYKMPLIFSDAKSTGLQDMFGDMYAGKVMDKDATGAHHNKVKCVMSAIEKQVIYKETLLESPDDILGYPVSCLESGHVCPEFELVATCNHESCIGLCVEKANCNIKFWERIVNKECNKTYHLDADIISLATVRVLDELGITQVKAMQVINDCAWAASPLTFSNTNSMATGNFDGEKRGKCADQLLELYADAAAGLQKEDLTLADVFKYSVESIDHRWSPYAALTQKVQSGGHREIYILTAKTRVVVGLLETFMNQLCEILPSEQITERADRRAATLSRAVTLKLGIEAKTDKKVCYSNEDMSGWSNSMLMTGFKAMIRGFSHVLPKYIIKLFDFIINIWTYKVIEVPDDVYQSIMKGEASLWDGAGPISEYLTKEILESGKPLLVLNSSFLMGIMHFTSSIYHVIKTEFGIILAKEVCELTEDDLMVEHYEHSDDAAKLITYTNMDVLQTYLGCDALANMVFNLKINPKKWSVIDNILEFCSTYLIGRNVYLPTCNFIADTSVGLNYGGPVADKCAVVSKVTDYLKRGGSVLGARSMMICTQEFINMLYSCRKGERNDPRQILSLTGISTTYPIEVGGNLGIHPVILYLLGVPANNYILGNMLNKLPYLKFFAADPNETLTLNQYEVGDSIPIFEVPKFAQFTGNKVGKVLNRLKWNTGSKLPNAWAESQNWYSSILSMKNPVTSAAKAISNFYTRGYQVAYASHGAASQIIRASSYASSNCIYPASFSVDNVMNDPNALQAISENIEGLLSFRDFISRTANRGTSTPKLSTNLKRAALARPALHLAHTLSQDVTGVLTALRPKIKQDKKVRLLRIDAVSLHDFVTQTDKLIVLTLQPEIYQRVFKEQPSYEAGQESKIIKTHFGLESKAATFSDLELREHAAILSKYITATPSKSFYHIGSCKGGLFTKQSLHSVTMYDSFSFMRLDSQRRAYVDMPKLPDEQITRVSCWTAKPLTNLAATLCKIVQSMLMIRQEWPSITDIRDFFTCVTWIESGKNLFQEIQDFNYSRFLDEDPRPLLASNMLILLIKLFDTFGNIEDYNRKYLRIKRKVLSRGKQDVTRTQYRGVSDSIRRVSVSFGKYEGFFTCGADGVVKGAVSDGLSVGLTSKLILQGVRLVMDDEKLKIRDIFSSKKKHAKAGIRYDDVHKIFIDCHEVANKARFLYCPGVVKCNYELAALKEDSLTSIQRDRSMRGVKRKDAFRGNFVKQDNVTECTLTSDWKLNDKEFDLICMFKCTDDLCSTTEISVDWESIERLNNSYKLMFGSTESFNSLFDSSKLTLPDVKKIGQLDELIATNDHYEHWFEEYKKNNPLDKIKVADLTYTLSEQLKALCPEQNHEDIDFKSPDATLSGLEFVTQKIKSIFEIMTEGSSYITLDSAGSVLQLPLGVKLDLSSVEILDDIKETELEADLDRAVDVSVSRAERDRAPGFEIWDDNTEDKVISSELVSNIRTALTPMLKDRVERETGLTFKMYTDLYKLMKGTEEISWDAEMIDLLIVVYHDRSLIDNAELSDDHYEDVPSVDTLATTEERRRELLLDYYARSGRGSRVSRASESEACSSRAEAASPIKDADYTQQYDDMFSGASKFEFNWDDVKMENFDIQPTEDELVIEDEFGVSLPKETREKLDLAVSNAAMGVSLSPNFASYYKKLPGIRPAVQRVTPRSVDPNATETIYVHGKPYIKGLDDSKLNFMRNLDYRTYKLFKRSSNLPLEFLTRTLLSHGFSPTAFLSSNMPISKAWAFLLLIKPILTHGAKRLKDHYLVLSAIKLILLEMVLATFTETELHYENRLRRTFAYMPSADSPSLREYYRGSDYMFLTDFIQDKLMKGLDTSVLPDF
jgi:hypothetical protein